MSFKAKKPDYILSDIRLIVIVTWFSELHCVPSLNIEIICKTVFMSSWCFLDMYQKAC